jgi:hypothetical protein
MPATITDQFKTYLIDETYNDFKNVGLDSADPDRSIYYIGIGRAQSWSAPDSDLRPPTCVPSEREVKSFMEDLQSIKRCTDVSRVVARYNWTNGNIYNGWNDNYHSELVFAAGQPYQNPFYVITSSNKVYVCIKQGTQPNGLPANSTILPADITGDAFETSDGYQWKYLYTVGTNDTQKFLTSGYLPSSKIYDSSEGGAQFDDLDPFQQEQVLNQEAAVPGEVIGVEVVNGGTSYPDGLYELEFDGVPLIIDGVVSTITPARAWATAIGGRIVTVSMKDPVLVDTYHFGGNYYDASVRFVSAKPGASEMLRPIISPAGGLGANAAEDLMSTALMFNVILDGNEGGDYIVDNDFRQIGLIRNILNEDSDGLGTTVFNKLDTDTALVVDAFQYNTADIGVSLNIDNIQGDNIITGQISGAEAVLHSLQEDIIYYSQNKNTGYKSFSLSEPIEISDGGGITSIVAFQSSSVSRTTGDVFYIDSRRPFMRSREQTEDIKIVIDF